MILEKLIFLRIGQNHVLKRFWDDLEAGIGINIQEKTYNNNSSNNHNNNNSNNNNNKIIIIRLLLLLLLLIIIK